MSGGRPAAIVTVQHTQSVHHTNGMVGSWTDWDLSELGREQARRITARLLPELAGKNVLLICSDLKRAVQTAEPLAAALGVPIQFRPALRERNLGPAVGKSVAWLRGHLECQEASFDDRCFAGAESRRDLWNRLRLVAAEATSAPADVVVVAGHGESLSYFHALTLGWELDRIDFGSVERALRGKPGGVTTLRRGSDGKFVLERLADLSYQAD